MKKLTYAKVSPKMVNLTVIAGNTEEKEYNLKVPDHKGVSPACYIGEIYLSGPEPSIYNNNNNERISRALFHVKHAQLR